VGDGAGFGDVWILSIPSFRWIKVSHNTAAHNNNFKDADNSKQYYADGPDDPRPHHSLTCDVVANSQMIIMGGTFPNHTTECDVPTIYGQHGLDLGKTNKEKAKWARFDPNVTMYKIPDEIVTVIGGAPTGGATITAPKEGWAHRDLEAEFQRAYTPGTRSATRDLPVATANSISSKTPAHNKKSVIGGAVGGVVGGLPITAGIGLWLHIRRSRKRKSGGQAMVTGQDLQQTTSDFEQMNHVYATNHSTQYPPQLLGSPHTPVSPNHATLSGQQDSKYGPLSQHQHYPSELANNQLLAVSPTETCSSPVSELHEMPVS
jgi:hypothetical protein